MCNLYSQITTVEAIRRLFEVARVHPSAGNLPAQSAIFPGYTAPVVRRTEGERELLMMSWGFVLPQRDKAAKRVTNARDEKVRMSTFWRESFEERRCLVPVTSFAEPKGRKPAVWHWFALKGEEPRPPFAFAGLWRKWKGPLKPGAEVEELNVYAVLTTTPNDVVRPVHPSRMPVMLSGEDQFDTWVDGSADEAFSLAKPFPAEQMHVVYTGETKDVG
ncbi:MAG: SOS response-associated peptidase [Hyphomicrobiaceae bacterium]|nr:SOS response-associated peptidase [Hyphomicrobiaceae bacterium]